MSIPNTRVPQIATDAGWTSGPEIGNPPRVALTLAQQKQGLLPAATIPAANFNALIGPMSDHIVQLSEIGARNWTLLPTVTSGVFSQSSNQYLGIASIPIDANCSWLFVFGSKTSGTVPMMGITQQGIDWITASSFPACTVLRAMAYSTAANKIVLVGDMSAKAFYSTDGGLNWIAVATHNEHDYVDVCYANGFFYAVDGSTATVGKGIGNGAYAATTTAPTGNSLLTGIRANGALGVLVWGSSNKTSISTNAGASWSNSASAVFASGSGANIADIRYSPGAGIWMAISTSGDVATSPDGVTWTIVSAALATAPASAPSLATDGSGVWVMAFQAGGTNRTVTAYSTDNGVTWKQIVHRQLFAYSPFVTYSPTQDCFYFFSKDTGTTTDVKVFRSLSTGTGGSALG